MREQVGYVDVDAGIVMVGDPCYTLPDDGTSRSDFGGDWGNFCDRLPFDQQPLITQPFEHKGAAVVVSAGFGDGTYPVFVEYYTEEYEPGKFDKRIKSLTIEFIGDEEVDEL